MAPVPAALRRADRSRTVGVDVARCLALVGMMCTHLLAGRAADGQVTAIQQVAAGRSSALFAVLAGVSLALATGRTEPPSGIRLKQARAALVMRAGLITWLGLWLGGYESRIAVILAYYGVLFVLALPFLGWGARRLAAGAAVIAAFMPVLSHLLRPHLPARVGQPVATDLADPVALLCDLLFTGTYPASAWLSYLLLGLAIGRLRLDRSGTARRLVAVGAPMALAGWLVGVLATRSETVQRALVASLPDPVAWAELEQRLISGVHGTLPTDSWWWLLVAAPHSTTTFDLLHTAGSAVVVLGACLLAARRRPRWWSVAFGAGAMTLTLYTAHVLLAATLLDRSVDSVLAKHLLLVLGFGAAFAALRLRGPLEAAVGWISQTIAAKAAEQAAERAIREAADRTSPGR